MRIGVEYGSKHLDLEIADGAWLPLGRECAAPALANPAEALRLALESPLGFPALRLALTPDDRVTILVDESLPHLTDLAAALLEHIELADVAPSQVCFVRPTAGEQGWHDALLPRFREAVVEAHDADDRKRLSYLATTKEGRRIYLNRSVVDADQLIVLGQRTFDPLCGYGGGETAIYPSLTDTATKEELRGRLSLEPPGPLPWPVREEAAEVAWLLGAPFFIQAIPAPHGEIQSFVTGMADTAGEAIRRLDAGWRVRVDRPADLVLATVASVEGRVSFADLARAAATATRVVRPHGRVLILCDGTIAATEVVAWLRKCDSPEAALKRLAHHPPEDSASAFLWASAAAHCTIDLLGGFDSNVAEELFAVPLDKASQVQRVVGSASSCVVIPEANRTLAVLAED